MAGAGGVWAGWPRLGSIKTGSIVRGGPSICGRDLVFSSRRRPVPSVTVPAGLTIGSLPLTSGTAFFTQFLRKQPDPMRNIVSLVATAVLATGLIVGNGTAVAQDSHLPDIGSSAGEVLGPAKQREYGER